MKTFNESDYAQIDAYLHNQLSLEEKQAVERRLHTEADFAAEVNWMRTFMSGYQQLRTRETVEEINRQCREEATFEEAPVVSIHGDQRAPALTESPARQRPFPFSWVAAAAVALLLLSIGTYLFLENGQSEKTVAKVDSQPKTSVPNPPATKPSTPDKPTELVKPTVTFTLTEETLAYLNKAPKVPGTIPTELNSAVSALNANKPDAALRLLRRTQIVKAPVAESASADTAEEPLFGADPTTSTTPTEASDNQRLATYKQFYTGLSYLRKGQPNRALRVFGTVEAPLRDAADWYSALSYLQLKQSNSGKQLLTRIATNPEHPYYADAKALLDRAKK